MNSNHIFVVNLMSFVQLLHARSSPECSWTLPLLSITRSSSPLPRYHLSSTETVSMTAPVYNFVVTARVRVCCSVCVYICPLKPAHVCCVMTAAVYNASPWQGSFGPSSPYRPPSSVTNVYADNDVIFSPLCDL